LLPKVLRYNGKSHALESQSEKFRHEIYSTSDSDDDEWGFAGVVNHSLSIEQAEDESAGMDAALEVLKNRLAAEKKEREANKCVAICLRPHLAPGGVELLFLWC
jgi:RNA polymerase II elongation factor ELL